MTVLNAILYGLGIAGFGVLLFLMVRSGGT